MKKQQIEKMESLFHLIQHEWQEISPLELAIYQLARGNTFNTRVIGRRYKANKRGKSGLCGYLQAKSPQ